MERWYGHEKVSGLRPNARPCGMRFGSRTFNAYFFSYHRRNNTGKRHHNMILPRLSDDVLILKRSTTFLFLDIELF
jgi:hypothetical protein